MLAALSKYLKGCHIEEGKDLLSAAPKDRTRSKRLKLQEDGLLLKLRRNFFTIRAVHQWVQLPREVMRSPSLQMNRHPLGMLELWISCIEQGVGQGHTHPIL